MNENTAPEFPVKFERVLQEYHQLHEPEPSFVTRLETMLLERHAEQHSSRRDTARQRQSWLPILPFLRSYRWQLVSLAILLALLTALIAAGPQRVLGQVQRLLGYLPGIGFVDLNRARVMPAPVQVRQGNVTLEVKEVLAEPDRTIVAFSTQGISAEDLPWPNPAIKGGFTAALRLPDGQRLEARTWQVELAAGKVEFPPIPENITMVTLEIPRLPLVPEGAAPQEWKIPLSLVPAGGKPPESLFPEPYTPTGAAGSENGITLEVLQVAQGPEETGILVRLHWQDSTWKHVSFSHTTLRDDLGHIYWQLPGPSNAGIAVLHAPAAEPEATPDPRTYEETLRLAPLSLAAHRGTLSVYDISYNVPAQASFSFDPGPDPQPGQVWNLDDRLEVAGIPVRLVAAWLKENSGTKQPEPTSRYSLGFVFEAEPQNDLRLNYLDLRPQHSAFRPGSTGGMSGTGRMEIRLNLDEIVTEPFRVQVAEAFVSLYGPLEVSWDLPEGPLSASSVRRWSPKGLEQSKHGMTLRVDKAFLSDRVSWVEISAPSLPEGTKLLNFTNASAYSLQDRPRLQDPWGRTIEAAQSVTWSQGGRPGEDPLRLQFGPLPPLTRQLTLDIPGAMLLLPGQAALEVEVPQGLGFHQEEYTVTVVGGGGPERKEKQVRWVSNPWKVDLPLEIAGYSLHFTQARVEQNEDAATTYRLVLTGEPVISRLGEGTLSMLRFSAVVRPDGEKRIVGYEYGGYPLTETVFGGIGKDEGSRRFTARLEMDVTAKNGLELLPGRYHVELSGVAVWVEGRWRFRLLVDD